MARISNTHQATYPVAASETTGVLPGDEISVDADIAERQARANPGDAIGIFDGLYEPGALERLRAAERA